MCPRTDNRKMGRERARRDATKVAPTLSRYTRLAALKAAALGLRRDVLVEVVLELVRSAWARDAEKRVAVARGVAKHCQPHHERAPAQGHTETSPGWGGES